MRANPLSRILCSIVVLFLLVNAVPSAASQEAPDPESDLPPRMRYLESVHVQQDRRFVPQAASALVPQALEDLGAWSKITYDAYTADNDSMEIFLINGDLSNLLRVTTTATIHEGEPRLNRGCTNIAYVYDNGTDDTEIYKMNANGSSQTNLTTNLTNEWFPYWNPAGDKIVYQSYNGTQTDVYSMNSSNGSSKVNLTNNSAWDGMPAYSPDGTRIVFASNRGGNDCIYTMNTSGGDYALCIVLPSLRTLSTLRMGCSSHSIRMATQMVIRNYG
jgi:hypothetical protein